jgi:hypothetical protein
MTGSGEGAQDIGVQERRLKHGKSLLNQCQRHA